MGIGLSHFLTLSLMLFLSGLIAVFARKNIIAILIGMELMLNASALNFVAYTRYSVNNLDGHIFALFIILIAAAEAAVGLAIAIRFYQLKESIHIDDAVELQQ